MYIEGDPVYKWHQGEKFDPELSEHLWISYKWFGVSHDFDKTDRYAGVPDRHTGGYREPER
jgi:hypothetical protein